MSSTNIFMRVMKKPFSLDGWIMGESSSLTYNGLMGWIEVESFSWNIETKNIDGERKETKGRPETSKVDVKHITIKKHFDKASPALYNMMTMNEMFETIELHFADPTYVPVVGISPLPVMMMVLHSGVFKSIEFSASVVGKGTALLETAVIEFTEMVMTYAAVDPILGYRTRPQVFHPMMNKKGSLETMRASLGV